MDNPDLPQVQRTTARRRLIRGALSAPALMTVCSGSAFAAASNLRCLVNAAGATTPPAAWGTTTPSVVPTFVRVQLFKVVTCPPSLRKPSSSSLAADVDVQTPGLVGVNGKVSGQPESAATGAMLNRSVGGATTGSCTNVDTYYVRGADLGTYARTSDIPANGKYIKIDNLNYATVGSPIDPPAPASVVSQVLVAQYVALRFNSSGVIVGIGAPGTGGGGMVGTSCWTSTLLPGR